MAIHYFTDLVQKFLDHKVSVSEFETAYIELFHKKSDDIDDDKAAEQVGWLFTEVDAYTDDPKAFIEDSEIYINEEQLRVSAQKTLDKLQK